MSHLTDEDRSFFKDNGFLIKRGLLRCSGDDSVPPGCGDLPLEDPLSQLQRGGYRGDLVVDLAESTEGDRSRTAEDGRQRLEEIMDGLFAEAGDR